MNKNPIHYEFRLSVFYAFVEFNDKTIRWNIVKNIIDKKITNMTKIYRNESTSMNPLSKLSFPKMMQVFFLQMYLLNLTLYHKVV